MIPEAVFGEVTSKDDRASRYLQRRPAWIRVEKAPACDDASLMPAKLHAGEIEVLLLARQRHAALVVLDDNAARKTAAFLGLDLTGALGILIAAKREGFVDSVGACLDELRAGGFRVSDVVASHALSQAGE